MRLDQWLWAVRVYKTRTSAAAAIKAGHVLVNDQESKTAREVRLDDLIVAKVGDITRTVVVVAFPASRVGAKLVPQFLDDRTPAEEYARRREPNFIPPIMRAKGSGRPTKQDRRAIDRLAEES